MSEMDETWEGAGSAMPGDVPSDPTFVDDDVDFDTAVFDNMMSVHLRAAFDGAGPSDTTEERILSALKVSLTRLDEVVPEVVPSYATPVAPAAPAAARVAEPPVASAPAGVSVMAAPMIDAVIPNVVEDGMSRVTPVHVGELAASVMEMADAEPVAPVSASATEVAPTVFAHDDVASTTVESLAEAEASASVAPLSPALSAVTEAPEVDQTAPDVTAPHPPLVVEEVQPHPAHAAAPVDAQEEPSEADEETERPVRKVPSLSLTAVGKPLKRTTYLAIAASLVAFVVVIAVANMRQEPLPTAASSSKTEQVAVDAAQSEDAAAAPEVAAAESAAAEGEAAPSEATAAEAAEASEAGQAEAAPAATQEATGAATADATAGAADAATSAGASQEAATATEETAESVSPAVAYPVISLKKGDVLTIVTADGVPTSVEATSVGEFVEEAVAHAGVKAGNHIACEVYHLIAQSDEDNGLFVVRYSADGAFYLARRQ